MSHRFVILDSCLVEGFPYQAAAKTCGAFEAAQEFASPSQTDLSYPNKTRAMSTLSTGFWQKGRVR